MNINTKCNIKVLDAVMGAGKTQYIFKNIKDRIEAGEDFRVLYVSPFLSEVGDPDSKNLDARQGRVHRECPDANFKSPTKSPSKRVSLKRLLIDGENVCCTHALFEEMDEDTAELLRTQGYEVIIDEAIEAVKKYDDTKVKKGDWKFIKQSIEVDPDSHLVSWIDLDEDITSFDHIKTYCNEKRLYFYRDSFWILELPLSVLTKAKQVTICTYLFEASYLYCYLKKYDLPFEYINNEAIKLDFERDIIGKAKQLITFVDCPYVEKIGGKSSLSRTAYDNMKLAKLKTIKGYLERLVERYLPGVGSSDLIWTCFANQKQFLSGKGYTRSWLACNARATNDYGDRQAGIYLVDRYVHPMVNSFLKESGAEVDEDLYALSEMLQWIWRLRIRNDEPIQLVIPSKRMRDLLQRWLDGEFIRQAPESMAADEAA